MGRAVGVETGDGDEDSVVGAEVGDFVKVAEVRDDADRLPGVAGHGAVNPSALFAAFGDQDGPAVELGRALGNKPPLEAVAQNFAAYVGQPAGNPAAVAVLEDGVGNGALSRPRPPGES